MTERTVKARTFTLGAFALSVAVAVAISPASSSAASCSNLFVTPSVKPALRAAHRQPGTLRPGSTYYGKCGRTRWAVATFVDPKLGAEDQPETFKLTSGVWRDLGDDGNLCKVPIPLIRLWRLTSERKDVCPT